MILEKIIEKIIEKIMKEIICWTVEHPNSSDHICYRVHVAENSDRPWKSLLTVNTSSTCEIYLAFSLAGFAFCPWQSANMILSSAYDPEMVNNKA